MKKTLSIVAVMATLSTPALAQTQTYVQGSLGLFSSLSDYTLDVKEVGSADMKGDNSFQIGGALGLKMNNGFRGEFEITQVSYDTKDDYGVGYKIDVDVLSISLNGYYDFDRVYKTLIPYVGAGIGISMLDGKDYAASEDADAMHMQFKTGLSFPLEGTQVSLFTDYTFKHIFEADFENSGISGITVDNLQSHTVSVGIRAMF